MLEKVRVEKFGNGKIWRESLKSAEKFGGIFSRKGLNNGAEEAEEKFGVE